MNKKSWYEISVYGTGYPLMSVSPTGEESGGYTAIFCYKDDQDVVWSVKIGSDTRLYNKDIARDKAKECVEKHKKSRCK